jgi:hypothetical protein
MRLARLLGMTRCWHLGTRNILGQHAGDGFARTPGGCTTSAYAAERITQGAPGRSPTTLTRVDNIFNNPTRRLVNNGGAVMAGPG